MTKSSFISNFFTANILYEENSRNYRRLVLLNALLYISIVASFAFVFINLFKLDNILLASMDFGVFILLSYASYDIHTTKRVQKATSIFIATLFVFLIALGIVNQNEEFGLIWTIFFPLVALLLMDKKQGFIIVNIFYLILLSLAFNGIGSWQNGEWSMVSFIRFFAASTTLTYIAYFMEYSQELSENQLMLTRKKEAEAMKSLHELSIKDTLTKLYNRRYLHEVFGREFLTAKRHNYYFGFFILDIDFFKQYNDSYGHQKGDEALCILADALQVYMRRSEDFIFRLGGEEFCGICVSDDDSKIQAQLKVLVHAVESLEVEHKSSSIAHVMTISMGAKIINNYEEYNFDKLYKEADEALYQAKEQGRNRLIFSQ